MLLTVSKAVIKLTTLLRVRLVCTNEHMFLETTNEGPQQNSKKDMVDFRPPERTTNG